MGVLDPDRPRPGDGPRSGRAGSGGQRVKHAFSSRRFFPARFLLSVGGTPGCRNLAQSQQTNTLDRGSAPAADAAHPPSLSRFWSPVAISAKRFRVAQGAGDSRNLRRSRPRFSPPCRGPKRWTAPTPPSGSPGARGLSRRPICARSPNGLGPPGTVPPTIFDQRRPARVLGREHRRRDGKRPHRAGKLTGHYACGRPGATPDRRKRPKSRVSAAKHPLLARGLLPGGRACADRGAPPRTRGRPWRSPIRKNTVRHRSRPRRTMPPNGAFRHRARREPWAQRSDGRSPALPKRPAQRATCRGFLRQAVAVCGRISSFSGGTSTGKTTFLNALVQRDSAHRNGLIMIEGHPRKSGSSIPMPVRALVAGARPRSAKRRSTWKDLFAGPRLRHAGPTRNPAGRACVGPESPTVFPSRAVEFPGPPGARSPTVPTPDSPPARAVDQNPP